MTDMPPLQTLDENAQILIKTLVKQLKINYPYTGIEHSSEIQGNGVFYEAIKSLVTVWICKCAHGTEHLIIKWLKIGATDLPNPAEAMKMLQHDHIMGELHARGLADFIVPQFTMRIEPPELQRLPYELKLPSLTLQGNTQQLLLITSPPILRPILKLSFRPDFLQGFCLHHIEFISAADAEKSTSGGCQLCPGSIVKYGVPYSKSFRFLIYNAKGAADPEIIHEVDEHSVVNDVDFVIVTETRLSGARSKHVRDLMNFNRSESVDPLGFSGGIWLLWSTNMVEFEIMSKVGTELKASMKVFERQDPTQSPIDY